VGIDEADIEVAIANEVRVLNKLRESGGNANIVTVFQHRWMAPGDIYVFDMELCEMDLSNFLKGDYITALGRSYFDPMYKGGVPECLTIWTIICHITRGLEYVHGLRELHRDLKPQNGMSSC